jgi:hypothetical protein
MSETSDTHATRDRGSGTASEPGIAYDPESVGETGQQGVPTGDQYPTEERNNIQVSGGSVGLSVPGTQTPGEPRHSGGEPTDTQGGRSLGDLTGEMGKGTTREDTGGLGSPAVDDEKSAGK